MSDQAKEQTLAEQAPARAVHGGDRGAEGAQSAVMWFEVGYSRFEGRNDQTGWHDGKDGFSEARCVSIVGESE